MNTFSGRSICITGGASFIGSHLAEALVGQGAQVTIVDDFSSGSRENLTAIEDQVRVVAGDLRQLDFAVDSLNGAEVVFHLAASHGGRGYIDTHPAECSSNMLLDGAVLRAAHLNGVQRFVFASSACIYPVELQTVGKQIKLAEPMADLRAGIAANADGEYGWAKLMGEMALAAYVRQYGMAGVSCRIFTAYGERENPTHAIIALILRAMLHHDPYVIWGDGTQTRNFTYVGDIVSGLIAAAANITDGSAVNVGSEVAYSTLEVANKIFDATGFRPQKVEFAGQEPTGVHYRNADFSLAHSLMGWSADTSLEEGLRRTIAWVAATQDLDAIRADFERRLRER